MVLESVNEKIGILYLTPLAPPYGGLANQTALLLDSDIFHSKCTTTVVRSNTQRTNEDPAKSKNINLTHFFSLLKNVSTNSKSPQCSIIFLRTNGDISFLRDMLIAVFSSIMYKKPLVVHLHASRLGFWSFTNVESLAQTNLSFIRKITAKLGYKFSAMLLNRASSFSQLSNEISTYYREIGFKEADFVIPNATVAQKVDFDKKKKNSILFVGRLSEEKGILDLLNALKLIKNSSWEINLLGSTTNEKDQKAIENIMSEHPNKNHIFFNGVVTGIKKWEFFLKSSILVIPSYLEVFPNVLLEGMTTGNAIISTNVGEVKSIINQNGTILVESANPEQLAKQIENLFAYPDRVKSMGKANLDHSSQYHIDRVASLFLKSINTALDSFEKKH